MPTQADPRARRRRYEPRHHPQVLARDEQARADLRRATAERRPRTRSLPAPAGNWPISYATSSSASQYLWLTGNEWATSTTSSQTTSAATYTDHYRLAASAMARVTPQQWVIQTSSVYSSAWYPWADKGPKTVIGDGHHPGLVHDWKQGDWVSKKVYNRRQTEREATANRLREERMAAQLVAEEARQLADLRADGLLMSLLSPDQQEQWRGQGSIEITTGKGRIVQLRKGWAGNAVEVCPRTRRNLRRFCIHAAREMPDADNVAAQMLLLQTDEDLFFATANASVIR